MLYRQNCVQFSVSSFGLSPLCLSICSHKLKDSPVRCCAEFCRCCLTASVYSTWSPPSSSLPTACMGDTLPAPPVCCITRLHRHITRLLTSSICRAPACRPESHSMQARHRALSIALGQLASLSDPRSDASFEHRSNLTVVHHIVLTENSSFRRSDAEMTLR